MILICEMEREVKEKKDGKTNTIFIQAISYFVSNIHINYESTDVKDILSQMINEIMENLDNYVKNGTGWYFKEVISLEIHTVDYKPLKGWSYIQLPEFIMRKKAIINMVNEDNKCFLWSVLRYLHPKESHKERLSDLRKYENDLNFKGIDFPIRVKDMQKFENQNPDLPGINVFSVNENNKIYPLRLNQKDNQKSLIFFFSQKVKNDITL